MDRWVLAFLTDGVADSIHCSEDAEADPPAFGSSSAAAPVRLSWPVTRVFSARTNITGCVLRR